MPGPAPNPNRRRRNAGPVMTDIPADARKGRRPPAWPLPDGPSEAEHRLWLGLWRLPQASRWELMEWHRRLVARYVRSLAELEAASGAQPTRLMAEVRQMEDRLGLSEQAMLKLRWRIVPAGAEVRLLAERRPRGKAVRAVDPGAVAGA